MSILNRQLNSFPRLREDSLLHRPISGFGLCVAGTLLAAGVAATGIVPGPESASGSRAHAAATVEGGALAMLLSALVGREVEADAQAPALPRPPSREHARSVTIARLASTPPAADDCVSLCPNTIGRFEPAVRVVPAMNLIDIPSRLLDREFVPDQDQGCPAHLLPVS
jgi:hypothetical protein